MPSFVLADLDGLGFQGRAGVDITVKVHSDNANVVMEGAVLSSASPQDLTVVNGKVTFQLAQGSQVLSVSIQRIDPHFADWQAVEVDSAGNTQVLKAVFVVQDPADPFSVDINLLAA